MNAYVQLASLPTPISARFVSENAIQVEYTTRDHVRCTLRRTSNTFFVPPDSNQTHLPGATHEVSAEIVRSKASPSGEREVILRETGKGMGNGKKRFVEIWKGGVLEVSEDVSARHGSFYKDDFYGSLAFSPSEDSLLYTAEANPPSDESKEAEEDEFKKYRYTPHLGEGFAHSKRPTTFLLRWTTDLAPKLTQHALLPSCLTTLQFDTSAHANVKVLFGQAVFASDTRIFATGYEYTADGRLLGIKFCQNRPTAIWELDLGLGNRDDGEGGNGREREETMRTCGARRITDEMRSSRSPLVYLPPATDRGGEPRVFWLSNERGGAHASCASLHSLSLSPESKPKTVVDTVWDPSSTGFPGIYTDFSLPEHPFHLSSDGKLWITMHSSWRSRTTLIAIDTECGEVVELTPERARAQEERESGDALNSWGMLATDGRNRIVGVRSSLKSVPEVVFGKLNGGAPVMWQVLHKPTLASSLRSELDRLEISICPIPGRFPAETILLKTGRGHRPCITIPHGGPHTASSTAFNASTTAFALEGYTISLPNYTGSTGYGEKYIKALIGQCGTLDVADCLATVEYLDREGVTKAGLGGHFVFGGSHGGFLGAHLIGRYPDLFTSAVLRNPVISAGEISTSDLPDWYFSEFGLAYGPSSLMTPAAYARLYGASPVSYVDNVRAPVLLLLGEEDERVAGTQGRGYYYSLKGRECGKGRVAMLVFKGEGHGLEGVEAGWAVWKAVVDWFGRGRGGE